MSEDKEQYRELIKLLVPINEFSPQLQEEAITIASINKYKKKKFVFEQGDKDGYSFYLLEGEIELLSDNQLRNTILGGTDSAFYPMAQLQPRQYSAKAKTEVTILLIDRTVLDRLMVAEGETDELSGGAEMEVSEIDDEDTGDWMTTMLQSELFCRLPTANIHQLFALLEPLEMNVGDTVIKQGDVGDHYYIIQEGRCEVTRSPESSNKEIKLAELKAGDSFGEEALLADAKRNASITMLSDGILMQLSKDNFINLIKKPTLDNVSYKDAQKLVEEGAQWLDVRFKNEHEDSSIEGSIHIPLNILRMQTDKLNADTQYVVYCDTGGRSSAATFLLTDRGFKACYLKDGMMAVPELQKQKETPEEKEVPKKEVPPKQEKQPKPKEPEKEESNEADEITNDADLEPSVRASVLEADIAKKEQALAVTKKQEEAQTATDKKAQKEAQKKLEEERKKLEAEKKEAEKEAKKIREQEAAKIKKLKEDAEKRLQVEKKQLEDVYAKNAKEMEKLQQMKKEAEDQIRKEREKLEQESAAAKAKLEQAAEEKRKQQEEKEKQMQESAKAQIEAERRKLAEEIAKTSEVMESAKREKVAADAARKAAEEEAKKIIDEYKQQFEKERAEEDVKLQEEREKLEEESQKIQQTLKEINQAKTGAEAARRMAEEETRKLKEQQKQDGKTQSKASQKAMDKELEEAEDRLEEARKNLADAEKAEHTIEEVKEVNVQELQRQKEEEEKLRQQVEAELAEFMEDYEDQAKERTVVVAHADHVKRIKEKSEQARKETENATDDLFSDIASQLEGD